MHKGLSFLPMAAFTLMRSPYYAAFYGCVLYKNPQYVPPAVYFRALLANDIHGFIRLKKKPLEDVFRGFFAFLFFDFGVKYQGRQKAENDCRAYSCGCGAYASRQYAYGALFIYRFENALS